MDSQKSLIAAAHRRNASSYDTDAQNYFDRIVSAGSTISTASKGFINTFVLAAKAHSYWTKINRINVFFGNDLTAALVPLKVGGGNSTETNFNFISSDYTEATGITGNNTTKYLDTGLLSSSLSFDDTSLGFYSRNSSASALAQGSVDGSSNNIRLVGVFFGFTFGNLYTTQSTLSTATSPLGFIIVTRSSGSVVMYQNGTFGSNGTADGAINSLSNYFFALNNNGSVQFINIGAAPIAAMYYFGSGLSGTDVANFNTDIEALMDSVGRGVQ